MKKWIKRGLALLLTGAMAMGMAGCGGSGGEETAAVPKKDFYYVPEYKEFDVKTDYFDRLLPAGDKAIIAGSSWDEKTGMGEKIIYQYDFMTGETAEFPLEMHENFYVSDMQINSKGNLVAMVSGSTIVGEAAEEQSLEEAGAEEGQIETEETEASSDEEAGEAQDASGESEGEAGDSEEASGADTEAATGSITVVGGADGPTYVGTLGATTAAASQEPEWENHMEIWEISASDGTVISKADIKPVFEDPDNTYIQYMVLDKEDNIYLYDGNFGIYVLDPTGALLCNIAMNDWASGMFASKEGTVYITKWGTSGGEEMAPVDYKTKSLGEPVSSEIFSDISRYNRKYYQGREKGLLISDNKGVFAYDPATDAKTDLFEWLDSDINSDEVEAVGELSDGRFWVILRSWDNNGESAEYSLAYLTKTPASEMKERKELVLGTMWLSQDIRRNVIDFNKKNEEYHISVKEYGAEDYQAGLTQFNNDVTGGRCPDIIELSGLSFEQYASKGVFEDLYPYMEKSGFKQEDYLENILKAYEVDGKLYGAIPQFYVSTTIGKTSLVGEESGWTLSEMLDFAENSNAENIFQYGTRSGILYYCIYNNIDEFINWETGECSFDGEDFARTLEFANQFPEEADYEDDGEGLSSKLHSDKILLMQTSVSSVQEYQMYNGLFGEEITFIGYPNSEKKGNLIYPTNGSFAVSAKSKNKDGAWEFVSKILSEEYQNGLVSEHGGFGFPVKKSALDKQFELDMKKEYYTDENGEKKEQMKTSWGYDDFSIDIYAATQEEIDAVMDIISSAEKLSGSVNEELINIVTEETAAFFDGQKTAKDAAAIIQNRVQIYVNENR